MRFHNLDIIAPALGAPAPSEAHVFGAATWLWSHSHHHFRLPLHELSRLLQPPVSLHQYILLASQEDGVSRPVGYVAWANLSAEAERRYIADPIGGLQVQDWCSGDRMWFTDWFAPFGHSRALARVAREVLPNVCARALYHRGNESGLRVQTFTGKKISSDQAAAWWAERPMLA